MNMNSDDFEKYNLWSIYPSWVIVRMKDRSDINGRIQIWRIWRDPADHQDNPLYTVLGYESNCSYKDVQNMYPSSSAPFLWPVDKNSELTLKELWDYCS
jgi:hypothetical protein